MEEKSGSDYCTGLSSKFYQDQKVKNQCSPTMTNIVSFGNRVKDTNDIFSILIPIGEQLIFVGFFLFSLWVDYWHQNFSDKLTKNNPKLADYSLLLEGLPKKEELDGRELEG